MSECGEQAVLLITMNPSGTTTNVARRRIELRCRLEAGHAGLHRDTERNEEWEPVKSGRATLLRQEED